MAAMASGASVLLALAVAAAGAVSAAGTMLVLALGLGLYARHWLSLAGRSRVGARSEDEVRSTLAPLQTEGWRLRHSLPWRGRGDIDSLALSPSGVGYVVETKRGRTTIAISLGCASRLRGWRGGVGVGVGAAPCRSCAWFARAASSGSSGRCWWSRSIG
jgi:hypothetical protein